MTNTFIIVVNCVTFDPTQGHSAVPVLATVRNWGFFFPKNYHGNMWFGQKLQYLHYAVQSSVLSTTDIHPVDISLYLTFAVLQREKSPTYKKQTFKFWETEIWKIYKKRSFFVGRISEDFQLYTRFFFSRSQTENYFFLYLRSFWSKHDFAHFSSRAFN